MYGYKVIFSEKHSEYVRIGTKKRTMELMKERGIQGKPVLCPDPSREERRDNHVL